MKENEITTYSVGIFVPIEKKQKIGESMIAGIPYKMESRRKSFSFS